MSCGSGGSKRPLVLACAGASNLGQLSYATALSLAADGKATMSCLAGVGAHLEGFVNTAREAETLLVIEGCGQRCAEKALAHAGVKPHVYVLLTEEGFEKTPGRGPDDAARTRARAVVEARLAS